MFVGAPLTPNGLNGGKAGFPEYHNVYVEQKNVDAYVKTGSFPEGTVFVKELTRVLTPTLPDGSRTEPSMREQGETAHRLAAYSDAVFAVIVTIMVLELKVPEEPAFSALWPLWPTAISYAVSYLFIAIIWINHHYLVRFVGPPTLGLIWINFIHLFMVALVPFATAWVARTRLASSPVAFYGGLFVCVDVAYNVFEHTVLARAETRHVSEGARRVARRRSLVVLAIFTTAMLVAFVAPRLGFALICAALILHLRPDFRNR